jgi:hypothetical protein
MYIMHRTVSLICVIFAKLLLTQFLQVDSVSAEYFLDTGLCVFVIGIYLLPNRETVGENCSRINFIWINA